MLRVTGDNAKFGVWLEAPDGTKFYLNTKSMQKLQDDLEMVWLNFFTYGFDGVVDRE